MKKLNEMFHIENEQLIKTSNGQPVPEDEPIFILRARDLAAIPALQAYYLACVGLSTPDDRLHALGQVVGRFLAFKETHPTKIPGSTHGK